MTLSNGPAIRTRLTTGNRPATRIWAYGSGVALAVAVGALALGAPSTYGQGEEPGSAYTRPTPALHGQSLAAYVAEHYDAREARTP